MTRKPYAAPSRLVTEPSIRATRTRSATSSSNMEKRSLTPGYGASSPQPCWSCAFIDTVRLSTCSGQIPNPDVTRDALVARWPRSFRPEDYDYGEPRATDRAGCRRCNYQLCRLPVVVVADDVAAPRAVDAFAPAVPVAVADLAVRARRSLRPWRRLPSGRDRCVVRVSEVDR